MPVRPFLIVFSRLKFDASRHRFVQKRRIISIFKLVTIKRCSVSSIRNKNQMKHLIAAGLYAGSASAVQVQFLEAPV